MVPVSRNNSPLWANDETAEQEEATYPWGSTLLAGLEASKGMRMNQGSKVHRRTGFFFLSSADVTGFGKQFSTSMCEHSISELQALSELS